MLAGQVYSKTVPDIRTPRKFEYLIGSPTREELRTQVALRMPAFGPCEVAHTCKMKQIALEA